MEHQGKSISQVLNLPLSRNFPVDLASTVVVKNAYPGLCKSPLAIHCGLARVQKSAANCSRT
jgi:hypothetical protein